MKVSALILAALCVIASARDNPAEQYYDELDCKPITESGDDHPSRYDCSHLMEQRDDQCYHKGKTYNLGDDIPKEETGPCITHCRCREGYPTGKAEIDCVRIECPSVFGVRPKEGCFNQYKPDLCCSVKQHCENDGEVATCEWEGKTYREGERFSPSGSCMNCVCMKGFDGTLGEPWCRKLRCDMNIHYGSRLRDGCVPTYYKVKDCCPIPVFRCPSDADKIEGEPVATSRSEENQCIFGELRVAKGQHLNNDPSNKCVRCSCEVPPHMTCVMDRQCYEGDRYNPDDVS